LEWLKKKKKAKKKGQEVNGSGFSSGRGLDLKPGCAVWLKSQVERVGGTEGVRLKVGQKDGDRRKGRDKKR